MHNNSYTVHNKHVSDNNIKLYICIDSTISPLIIFVATVLLRRGKKFNAGS
jgi:hypothetical protein